MHSTWWTSIGIHLLVVGSLVVATMLRSGKETQRNDVVAFEVIETQAPVEEAPEPERVAPQEIDIAQKKEEIPQPLPEKVPERVFGINDDTLKQDEGDDGIVLKRGNTVTKEVDDKILEDDTPLPTPKPEYLVSQMPVVLKEVPPAYPPEAKEKGLEGDAVLRVLVDELGKVRLAEVIEDPGFGMGKAAQEALYQYEFTPAKIGETAVAVEMRYVVTFQLL